VASNSATFSIDKAPSTMKLDCSPDVTYDGSAKTPCLATVEAPRKADGVGEALGQRQRGKPGGTQSGQGLAELLQFEHLPLASGLGNRSFRRGCRVVTHRVRRRRGSDAVGDGLLSPPAGSFVRSRHRALSRVWGFAIITERRCNPIPSNFP
jgi:hypothetical protein